MFKDIQPIANQWVDVYAESGFPVGSSVRLQNKTDSPAYICEGAAPPVLGPEDWKLPGYELVRHRPARVFGNPEGLWVFCWNPLAPGGKGVIFVQEIEA